MTQGLAWVTLGLGGLSLVHAFVRARHPEAPIRCSLRPLYLSALAILVLGFLMTLPTTPPWSPGQSLGPGFLVGGGSMLLSAALASRGVALAGAFGVSAAGVAALQLLSRPSALDVFSGYGLGAVTVGILFVGGVLACADDERARHAAGDIGTGTLIAVAVAGTTFLAVLHRGPTGDREWIPLPALFAGVLAVGTSLRALLCGPSTPTAGRAWGVTLGALFLPAVVMAWVIGNRLHGEPSFLPCVLIGMGVMAVVAMLEGVRPEAGDPRTRAQLGVLCALLVLGGSALAYRFLHGLGLGAALLGGSLALLLPSRDGGLNPDRPLVRGSLALGVALLLYRVFEESADYRQGPQPDFFYYHAALATGALLPLLLAGLVRPAAPGGRGGLVHLLRIGLAGLIAAVAPLVLWVLVGPRPEAGFLVGLGLGVALQLFLAAEWDREAGGWNATPLLASLLAIGMLLSAAEFTANLEPLSLWTRAQRITLLAGVGGVAIVWLLVTEWVGSKVRK